MVFFAPQIQSARIPCGPAYYRSARNCLAFTCNHLELYRLMGVLLVYVGCSGEAVGAPVTAKVATFPGKLKEAPARAPLRKHYFA
ncbi:MAG: hypothetical protein DMG81_04845 [Acidobacteria bacterium]|nr:MAG: hypothetical protein DMG81_04845 [Acidobacteriota bacterium]